MYSARTTDFETGFFFELLRFFGPMVIVFGLFLFYCIACDYSKLSQAAKWSPVNGNLTAVRAAPYVNSWLEPGTCFMNSAAFFYSYQVAGCEYTGVTELVPQGPRFYDGLEGLMKSGDVASQLKREKVLRDQALKNPEQVFAPIGGWRQTKSPYESAKPFRYSSLNINHALRIKYNALRPAESVLDEMLEEHSKKLLPWACGSVLTGIAIIMLFRFKDG
jgi:hypothetical protein